MPSAASRILAIGACLAGLIIFAWLSHAPLVALAVNVLTVGSAAIVGAFLMRWLVPGGRSVLGQIVVGTVVVLTLNRVLLMVLGFVVRFDLAAFAILGATVAASIVLLAGAHRQKLALPAAEAPVMRQILWLSGGMFALMGLAYIGVTALTPAGFAFPSYFNHDFLQHGSVVAELTRGLPPANPYMLGSRLHYYWFYHLWPATVASMTGVSALHAMTATSPFVALVFTAALMTIVNHVNTRARSLAVTVALFAPSLLGLLAAISIAAPALFAKLPGFGAPGFSFISHSWYRDALYELHALTALSMAMAVFYLSRLSRGRITAANATVQGVLLGMIFMTDAIIALVVTAYFGLESLVRLLKEPATRLATIILGISLGATVAVTIAVGAVPVKGGLMTVGLHSMAKIAPIYLTLEVGPLLLLALLGFWLSRRTADLPDRPAWLALSGVCLIFMFLIFVPTEMNVVIRKAMKVLQIPLVVLAAPACAFLLQTPVRRALAAVVVLVGGLTVATDIRHYLQPAPSYVNYITTSQMETLDWVRRCTSPDVVVQDLMAVKPGDKYLDTYYSGIASIAERRTLWGDSLHPYLFRADDAAIEQRRRAVDPLSVAPSPEALQQSLADLPMDLLYVDRTRSGPLDAVATLVKSGFLRERYCSADVCVYTVGRRDISTRCIE